MHAANHSLGLLPNLLDSVEINVEHLVARHYAGSALCEVRTGPFSYSSESLCSTFPLFKLVTGWCQYVNMSHWIAYFDPL